MKKKNNSILDAYQHLLGKQTINSLRKKAKNFEEKTVLQINSTKFGGGVAEILNNMIPMIRELKIDAEWKVFSAPKSFFQISKKMHNALQGNMSINFSEDEISAFLEQAESTYEQIQPNSDFVIIHDPQPSPVIEYAHERSGKWIWRCHIDTSVPNPQAWNLISRYLSNYDALIFTKVEYARPGINNPIYPIPPSIDPFSEKNRNLDKETANDIVKNFVPLDRPLITQVSRFDPWKDPLGVIDVFRKVREKIPVRLALIGSLAHDDPEGIEFLEKVKNYASNDPEIHILTNLDGVADLEVNAFQQVSDIVLQKSLREGFGLTIAEALWKETPVIGGNVGGIKLQIENGINGFLVNSIDETVEKILYLLANPSIAKKMGKKGYEKIKNEFLLTHHLEKYLDLFKILSK